MIIEARHLCMVMRGVEKQNSTAMTSAMLGDFRENKQTRDEFLSLVNSHGHERHELPRNVRLVFLNAGIYGLTD